MSTIRERLGLVHSNSNDNQSNTYLNKNGSTIRERLGLSNYNIQSNSNINLPIINNNSLIPTQKDLQTVYTEAKAKREALSKEYKQKYSQSLGSLVPRIEFKDNQQEMAKKAVKEGFKSEPETITKFKQQKEEFNKASKEFHERDDIKQLSKERTKARNEELIADYQIRENEINSKESSGWDKNPIVNTLRGAKSLIDPFINAGDYVTREDGAHYWLPSDSDLKMQKAREDSSGFNKFLIDVGYNAGKIIGSEALNAISGGYAGSALYYGNMYTSSLNNAISQGYDKSNAFLYAAASTGAEVATGKLLGSATKGLTKGNILQLDDAITNKLMTKFGANKTIAKVLGNAGSEATEEFLQEYIENFNKLMFLEGSKDAKDYGEIFVKDGHINTDILTEALYSAGVGAVSGGTLGTVSSSQNVYDIYRNQLTELKSSTTDTETINQIDNIIKEIDNVKYSTSRNEEVESDIDKVRNYVKSNETTTNIPTVQDLVNRSDNPFKYEKTDNQIVNNLRKSASRYFDDSENTHNLVNNIEKIAVDKGYNIIFDNSIANDKDNLVNGKITILKNGEIEIRVNPNSNRAGEFIIMHELTHAIETKSMKDLVLNYASKHPEFNEALKSLQKTYGTDDVSSEVLADISGQLFGNQEFINSLSLEQPSFFRRIYNSIISLANKITGNSNEALFLKDLENKWREAYRTQHNNLNNNGYLSMNENNNTINNIKESERIDLSKLNSIDTQKKLNKISFLFEVNNNELKNIESKTNSNARNRNIELKPVSEIMKLFEGGGSRNLSSFVEVINDIKNNGIIDPVFISKETGRIADGNHRLFIANELGMKNIPVKYINSSNEIDTSLNKWYPNKQGGVNDQEGNRINSINDRNWNEQVYNSRSITSVGDRTTNSENNRLYNQIQEDDNRPSIETSDYIRNSPTKELDDSSFSLKEKQLDIILNSNPAGNDTATWIRDIDDIKTFEETLQDSDWIDYVDEGFNPDYTGDMVQEALDSGKIKVYSSYPIEQGIFVTPSKMEAESYSGNGKVYSKEVNLEDVAWIDPTQGQYAKVDTKYSQNNNKWQQYLEKYYKATGTRLNMKDILLSTKEEVIQDIAPVSERVTRTSSKSNLTSDELTELEILKTIDDKGIDLDKEERKRLQYLKNKSKGLIKYPELPTVVTFEDIKNKYSEYKDLTDFDSKILDKAKSFVEGYQNTGKRTKQQWLEIANFIGSNLNAKTSETLEKYAIQSWHEAKPNTKETLNRQGQKYVKFTIDEWVNAIYKGAGVGTVIQEAKVIAPTVNKNIAPIVLSDAPKQINENKTLNPIEISQLTPEDANTTPILPIVNRNKTNDGDSHFAKNIQNKTNMLSEEQKSKILSNKEVQYYDKVTNKESLETAYNRLQNNGKIEGTRWFNKPSENADSSDVAEGWILLKQYADAKDADNMVEVAKKLRDIGTKAGQTVQAFNIMERMTPEGMVKYAQSELLEAYNKMSKNKTQEWIDKYKSDFDLKPDEVQFIMDTMKEVSTMEDGYDKRVKLAEIQKLMTDKLPPTKGAGIKSWMRISMLFNPKTQARNVFGNAIIMPVNSFGDLFANYADKIISKKTGVRTVGKTNIKAIFKGMKEGAYQATNDYKKGINTKDMEGNRFEIGEGKSFNDKTLMGKSLNRIEGLLNYVMDAGDRVFSQAAFENSLQNQLVLNNTNEITQEMLDIARSESLQRTWNDNNNYTKFVLNVRKGLNQIHFLGIETYGLGDILIPFAKTPANLTKAIVDYSPAGLVKTIVEGNNLRKSLSNGQYNAQMQHQFVQDLGKATAGTMLYVLGYALATAGITSGESDDDKDVSNFMKNTLGISSYSIKIGNNSFTYDWAQPIAAPLSIMANVVNSKKNKGQALTEAIVGSLDTAGSILLEQSFLTSINEVLNDNDGVVSGLINEMLELPARAVPTFSKQIADMVDSTQRTSFEYGKPIESAFNSIKAKIPFLSKTLAPTVDTMGREIQKYGGKTNIFNVFLNPANVNSENISKSAEEIYRLYKVTGDTTIMPRVAPYYINQNGEKITMSSSERSEYQKISGKIIENGIEELLKTSNYNQMSDDKKTSTISDLVNYSYNIAKKEVLNLELSKTYQKAYEYSQIGNISDYYSFKNSIDDTNKDTKKESITNYLINSDLNDKQLAHLYGSYYSSEKVLNNMLNANIPIKEFIKFNSQEFENDYNANGKVITNSAKNKVINFVNNLSLSIPQKALLIKSKYSSYKKYDSQIIEYVNSKKLSFLDKAKILKDIGFSSYDNQIINYVNQMNLNIKEKSKMLEDMGFIVRDGRVYSK